MSGAVAAHAAYNGSGTQGLAVTNKISDPTGADVMSVFWNKNDTTRQLLHGAAFIDIPTSGNGGSTSYGGNQIFTLNNDIDAVGELFLHINATNGTAMAMGGSLASIIKRIEFHVGTQIWHTLEKEDIIALNNTEMPEGVHGAATRSLFGSYTSDGKKNKDATLGNVVAANAGASGVLRIPTISRKVFPTMSKFSNHAENAYLVAAAPHQTVKIKVYLESTTYVKDNVFINANGQTGLAANLLPTLELKLYGQHLIMCNEEREQMKKMTSGMPKRIKMSQNVTYQPTDAQHSHDGTNGVTSEFSMDLDHFSLYASHLIVTLIGKTQALSSVQHTSATAQCLDEIELKLNSSSFSGTLKGSLLLGPSSDMLGLHHNVESHYDGTNDNPVGVYRTYVFPLASQAYTGSSVPLNRFDNIRLSMLLSEPISQDDVVSKVVVTCAGETTALFKGGAASLAMY